jgi:acetate kinase
VLIDDACLAYLRTLIPLMPLHLPNELAPVELIRKNLPDLHQVAVFDTGFHRGHDQFMQRLPIPEWLHREGVLSYGYHGISYVAITVQAVGSTRMKAISLSLPVQVA